jgi:putative transposase
MRERASFELELREFNGEAEHVQFPSTVAMSRLVNTLKGVSSVFCGRSSPACALRAKWLWSGSYFAGSAGGASGSVPRQCIEKQEPHPDLPMPGCHHHRSEGRRTGGLIGSLRLYAD